MDKKVLGIFYDPWQGNYSSHRSFAELYRRAVWLKANPRNERYMRDLFSECYPQGTFVTVDKKSDWQRELLWADTIVLLYPDATGLHFSWLESIVLRKKRTAAEVRVLSGRRRNYSWTAQVRRELRLRRLVEQSMLGELLAIVIFVSVTPFFLVSDLVRGRR